MKSYRFCNFGTVKENHINKEQLIVLNNLFGAEASSTLLFFKTEHDHWSALKSFLEFLNIMPENDLVEITSDTTIKQKLMEL